MQIQFMLQFMAKLVWCRKNNVFEISLEMTQLYVALFMFPVRFQWISIRVLLIFLKQCMLVSSDYSFE